MQATADPVGWEWRWHVNMAVCLPSGQPHAISRRPESFGNVHRLYRDVARRVRGDSRSQPSASPAIWSRAAACAAVRDQKARKRRARHRVPGWPSRGRRIASHRHRHIASCARGSTASRRRYSLTAVAKSSRGREHPEADGAPPGRRAQSPTASPAQPRCESSQRETSRVGRRAGDSPSG